MDKGSSNNAPNFGNLLGQANASFPGQYKKGTQVYLGQLNKYLNKEQQSRELYDWQRIAEQQGLQSQFGPTQYAQQLQALQAIDPAGYALREGTAGALQGGVNAGTSLTPDQESQLEQEVRRSEAARGNIYGQAPVEAEAFTKGLYGQNLYQQRLGNALQFQNSATPESWLTAIPPISADRSMAYVNPNAGFLGVNASNAAFQNALGTAGLGMNQQSNPWMSILGTAATVAPLLIGAFSDRRLKSNIVKIGKMGEHNLYHYTIQEPPREEIGVMADEVAKTNPDAVFRDKSGYLKVDYSKLGFSHLPLRF